MASYGKFDVIGILAVHTLHVRQETEIKTTHQSKLITFSLLLSLRLGALLAFYNQSITAITPPNYD